MIENLYISKMIVKAEEDSDVIQYTHKKKEEIIVVPSNDYINDLLNEWDRLIEPCVRSMLQKNAIMHDNLKKMTQGMIMLMQSNYDESFKNIPKNLISQDYYEVKSQFGLLCNWIIGKNLLSFEGISCFKQKFDEMDGRGSSKWSNILFASDAAFKIRQKLKKIPTHPKLHALKTFLENHFSNQLSNFKKDLKAIVFTQYRNTVSEILAYLEGSDVILPKQFIGQSKKNSGETGISQKEQKQILSDFRCGIYNTLISTSIGEEGLDINVDLVICYDVQKSAIRNIQRLGRTGRMRDGKVCMLVSEGIEHDFLRSSADKTKKFFASLKSWSKKCRFMKSNNLIPLTPIVEYKEIEISPFQMSQIDKRKKRKSPNRIVDNLSEESDDNLNKIFTSSVDESQVIQIEKPVKKTRKKKKTEEKIADTQELSKIFESDLDTDKNDAKTKTKTIVDFFKKKDEKQEASEIEIVDETEINMINNVENIGETDLADKNIDEINSLLKEIFFLHNDEDPLLFHRPSRILLPLPPNISRNSGLQPEINIEPNEETFTNSYEEPQFNLLDNLEDLNDNDIMKASLEIEDDELNDIIERERERCNYDEISLANSSKGSNTINKDDIKIISEDNKINKDNNIANKDDNNCVNNCYETLRKSLKCPCCQLEFVDTDILVIHLKQVVKLLEGHKLSNSPTNPLNRSRNSQFNSPIDNSKSTNVANFLKAESKKSFFPNKLFETPKREFSSLLASPIDNKCEKREDFLTQVFSLSSPSPKKKAKPKKKKSIKVKNMKYIDEEAELSGCDSGDEQEIETTGSLRDFINDDTYTQISPLKRTISSSQYNEFYPSENNAIHNYSCRGCKLQTIKGSLYKCQICTDYMICEKCFNMQFHRKHDFDSFDSPEVNTVFFFRTIKMVLMYIKNN